MADAKLPEQPIDGASMTPLLTGQSETLQREAIYFHYPHYHHSRPGGAIRIGDWKLIEWFEGSPGTPSSYELYNLADDIGETKDLASAKPPLVKKLAQRLAAWRKRVGARMPVANPAHNPKRAGEWFNRRSGKPLDLEAMRKRYESKR